MGTMPIFRTALFLAVAVSSGLSTTTTTTTTVKPRIDKSVHHTKSKRGIAGIGTNIWANHGVLQATQNNPGVASLLTIPGNNLPFVPNLASAAAGYNNDAQTSSSFGNQNHESSPQTQSTRVSQSYVPVPQKSGQANTQTTNSGYTGYYTAPVQNVSPQDSTIYAGYQVQASPSSTRQVQAQQTGQVQSNPIATPYFNSYVSSPSNLKLIADNLQPAAQYKATLGQNPVGQQSVQKIQTQVKYPSSERQIPVYSSLDQNPSYELQTGPAYSATSQALQGAQQVPVYKTNHSNEPRKAKLTQTYAPHYQDATYLIPSVQSYDKLLQSAQYNVPTVDLEGKKIPLPVLQLQSAEDFPGFAQTVQAHNQPLVLESGVSYQAHPGLGSYLDFGKAGLVPRAGNPLPFLSAEENIHQAQILPVPSSSSTPQFPQYKGAKVNTFPISNLAKPPGVYQALKSQPQLHFSEKPVLPASTQPAIVHQSKPSEEILEDVEIITKKKPTPQDDEEDDVDDGYKYIEREYGPSGNEDRDEPRRGKYFKESESDGDFKPSKSFPFKSYDEKFGKYSKLSSKKNTDDKPYSKYKHHSSSDDNDDDDYDGHSSRIRSDYSLPKPRRIRYDRDEDDEEEEESQKHEKQEEAEEEEEDEQHETAPKTYRDYGYDFDREFEESYKRELPKNKYIHTKEVPDIEEPTSHSHKSYSNQEASKSSKDNDKDRNRHRDDHEANEDSKGKGSQTYRKYWKSPKISFKDSEGYGTSSTHKKAPKVVHEETFGYKKPSNDNYSRYTKSGHGNERYSNLKTSPKEDSYLQASRTSYKSNSPENKDKASYEKGDSYSYSSGNSWKSNKKSPESEDSYGHSTSAVRSLAEPDVKSSFLAPSVNEDKFHHSKSSAVVRDLTGI